MGCQALVSRACSDQEEYVGEEGCDHQQGSKVICMWARSWGGGPPLADRTIETPARRLGRPQFKLQSTEVGAASCKAPPPRGERDKARRMGVGKDSTRGGREERGRGRKGGSKAERNGGKSIRTDAAA